MSQSYYGGDGIYASEVIALDAWQTVNPADYPNHGAALRRAAVHPLLTEILSRSNIQPDANTVYVLLVSSAGIAYEEDGTCAWHDTLTIANVTVPIIFAHNGPVRCRLAQFASELGTVASYVYYDVSAHAQGLAASLARQLASTVTSPLGTGWFADDGAELGSLCGLGAALAVTTSGAAYTVELGPAATKYLIPELYNLRQGACVIASELNVAGMVTCTRPLQNLNCSANVHCHVAGSSCILGQCTCAVNSCAVNERCVAFPAPAQYCSAFSVAHATVYGSPVRQSVGVNCDSGSPSIAQIYCMSNGLWDAVPSCLLTTTTSTSTSTTTTTTTPSHCLQFLDCRSCANQSDCGWCASAPGVLTGLCFAGMSAGTAASAAQAECAAGQAGYWSYFAGTCARPTTTTTASTTTTHTACDVHQSCSACIASLNCGWCASSPGGPAGTCYAGSNTGATVGNAPSLCISNTNRLWYRTICPVQCVAAFTPCTLFCGLGTMTYIVSQPVANGGVPCPYLNGTVFPCNRKNCISCLATEFEFAAPTATSDRVCHNIRVCSALQFESQAATALSDRICTDIKTCNSSTEFQSAAPTPTSDRVCTALTYCSSSQYETAAPTATTDRQCFALVACPGHVGQHTPNGAAGSCSNYSCPLTCNTGCSKTGDFSCAAGVWDQQFCAICPFVQVQGATLGQYNQIFKYTGVFAGFSFYVYSGSQPLFLFRTEQWMLGVGLGQGDYYLVSDTIEPFAQASPQWRFATNHTVSVNLTLICASSAVQFSGSFGTASGINNVFASFGAVVDGSPLYINTAPEVSPKYFFVASDMSQLLADSVLDDSASAVAVLGGATSTVRTNGAQLVVALPSQTVFGATCALQPTVPSNGVVSQSCSGTAAGDSCALTCNSGFTSTGNFTCIAGQWDAPHCEASCTGLPSPFVDSSCAGTVNGGTCSTLTLCPAGKYAPDDFACENGAWSTQSCAACPYLRIEGSSVADGFFAFLRTDAATGLPVYVAVSNATNSTVYLYGAVTGSGKSAAKEWRLGDGQGEYSAYAAIAGEQFPYFSTHWLVFDGASWLADTTTVTCACPVVKLFGGTGATAFLNGVFAQSKDSAWVFENVLGESPEFLYRVPGAGFDTFAVADLVNASQPYLKSNQVTNLTAFETGVEQVVWSVDGIQARPICPAISCSSAPSVPAFGTLVGSCAGIASGGSCSFTCSQQYVPSGVFTCQAGSWSSAQCLAPCASVPQGPHVSLVINCANSQSGHTCPFNCNAGYFPTASRFTCSDGAWDNQGCIAPTCAKISVQSHTPALVHATGTYVASATDAFGGVVYAASSGTGYIFRHYGISPMPLNSSLLQSGSWVLSHALNSVAASDVLAFSIFDFENPTPTEPFDVFGGAWYVPAIGLVEPTMEVICQAGQCAPLEAITANNTVFSSSIGTYASNQNCEFRITAPAGFNVQVSFQSFDLQPDYDYVYVYNGDTTEVNQTLSGADTPEDIVSTAQFLQLVFVTNGDTTRPGFTATATFVPDPSSSAAAGASSSSPDTGVIVGPVVGGAAFVAIVVVAVVLARRRRTAQKNK